MKHTKEGEGNVGRASLRPKEEQQARDRRAKRRLQRGTVGRGRTTYRFHLCQMIRLCNCPCPHPISVVILSTSRSSDPQRRSMPPILPLHPAILLNFAGPRTFTPVTTFIAKVCLKKKCPYCKNNQATFLQKTVNKQTHTLKN